MSDVFKEVSGPLRAAVAEEIDRARGDVPQHEYLSGLITAAIARDLPAVVDRLRRRGTSSGEWWERVRAVEIGGLSDGRLVLALNPGFQIHPEASEHCEQYPGEIDLVLDDGRGPIGIRVTGETARLPAYRLLAASAEHEWRVAHERERDATETVAELRQLPGDELRAQRKAIKVRRARLAQSRCELIFTDDDQAQSGRLANAQRLIEKELRRRRATGNAQAGLELEAAGGCGPAGSGE